MSLYYYNLEKRQNICVAHLQIKITLSFLFIDIHQMNQPKSNGFRERDVEIGSLQNLLRSVQGILMKIALL